MHLSPDISIINRYGQRLKERFSGRVQKVSLHAGLTCPNRDGKVGIGGCTYCNNKSFSPAAKFGHFDIYRQINQGIEKLENRYKNVVGYLAYFQTYSNTYGDFEHLKRLYGEALSHPKVIGLCIGTRPDCVDDKILEYLARLNESSPIFLEYGVESVFDESLERINRGHDFKCSEDAITKTAELGIPVGAHLILGFPWESKKQWVESARKLSELQLDSIKLHQLHIVKNTIMGNSYVNEPFPLPSPEEYIDGLSLFLANLNPEISIQRLFAHAPREMLLSTPWEEHPQELERKLFELMEKRKLFQGKFYKPIQLTKIVPAELWPEVPGRDADFLHDLGLAHRFTFQQRKELIDMAKDLFMWSAPSVQELWSESKDKDTALRGFRENYVDIKEKKKSYPPTFDYSPEKVQARFLPEKESARILGPCPVASEKTLCCNLQTLDAVRNCGFDCSYCSIQNFYSEGETFYERNLKEKLAGLKLDPDEIHHFSTGQSSDSLIWGNRFSGLEALFEFAENNPNVILELKTKSKNIRYLLEVNVPSNVICTWSLNPQIIIDSEEHYTADLNERIDCARKLVDKGILVGFHLHPIIYYEGFERDYRELAEKLQRTFAPEEVVMVSMGTLTFTKKVRNKIRARLTKTKVLQMPFEESAGKLSYPMDLKLEMFKAVYHGFTSWHESVFFYLCMEHRSLWKPVLNRDYATSNDFELDMKKFYLNKISKLPYFDGV